MFDKMKITLVSGKGGDGAIAFRHEKSVEMGGPYGGNGGKGGSIIFKADNGVASLVNYRFGKTFKAEWGENGKSKLQYGHDGKDIILPVPVGTVIEDEQERVLADLSHHGDTYLAVKGGRGGRGNAAFKSPNRRTPNIAENGLPGETKEFYLELKLLADVGLVGFPNVGKSTFLSSVTRAKAEIAPYAFTTLDPQLGVCFIEPDKSFIIADLPGLIEGASQGKGLGFTFLRHIERCLVLLHVLDCSNEDYDLKDAFDKINNELFLYRPELKKRKMVIALNKIDSVTDRTKIDEFEKEMKGKFEIFEISAKENKGLNKLNRHLYSLVKKAKDEKEENLLSTSEERVYTAKNSDNGKLPSFKVVKREDGYFEILGDRVVRTKKLINIKTDEGMDRLLAYLDKIGIDKALHDAGCVNGDTVVLDDFEFEYFE